MEASKGIRGHAGEFVLGEVQGHEVGGQVEVGGGDDAEVGVGDLDRCDGLHDGPGLGDLLEPGHRVEREVQGRDLA